MSLNSLHKTSLCLCPSRQFGLITDYSFPAISTKPSNICLYHQDQVLKSDPSLFFLSRLNLTLCSATSEHWVDAGSPACLHTMPYFLEERTPPSHGNGRKKRNAGLFQVRPYFSPLFLFFPWASANKPTRGFAVWGRTSSCEFP